MGTNTHILAIPFPLQGHINPMIQLCKRLAWKGVGVTLVTTVSLSSSLERRAEAIDDVLINYETVPDASVDEVEGLDEYELFFLSFRRAISSGLPDIIAKYVTTLRAVVYDSCVPWVLELAHEKGLKGATLFTQPCVVCSVFYHVHKGSLVIPPEDGASEDSVSLPGMPAMGVQDLPCFVCGNNFYSSLLTLVVEQFSTFEKADWRLFNTFDKLEEEMLKWMAKKYEIRTVGPTVPSMYTDKRLAGNYDYGLSLFKPKTESCMKWLDAKEDRSVVYVSFGSLADLSEKQMEEVAWGLIESRCNFLWVVRETEQSKLPQHLLISSGLIERGLIVKWCTQLEVLTHRAVACFMTHCGWNSTIEALSLGVPMVAMPRWTDQTTTAKLVVDLWRTGVRVEVDDNEIVTREEVATRVNEVMQRDRGEEMRRTALKWKELAIEAVSEGGSSDKNITEIARQLLNT